MQQYEFYLGCNVSNIKNAVKKSVAIKFFSELLKAYYMDNFTVISGDGYYKGVSEKTIIFRVIDISVGNTFTDKRAKDVAVKLAKQFQQESILLVKNSKKSWLLFPDNDDLTI